MSLLNRSNLGTHNLVTIHDALKRQGTLYQWLQEEARKQGISVEQFIAHIVEEKGKDRDAHTTPSGG